MTDNITMPRQTVRFAVELLDEAAAYLTLYPSLGNKLRRIDIDLRALLRDQPVVKESLIPQQQAEPVAMEKIKHGHSKMRLFDFEQHPDHEYAGFPHRPYASSYKEGCYLCACLAEIQRLQTKLEQQAEPLTDEQIHAIAGGRVDYFDRRVFARAIEAAHGIGEKK